MSSSSVHPFTLGFTEGNSALLLIKNLFTFVVVIYCIFHSDFPLSSPPYPCLHFRLHPIPVSMSLFFQLFLSLGCIIAPPCSYIGIVSLFARFCQLSSTISFGLTLFSRFGTNKPLHYLLQRISFHGLLCILSLPCPIPYAD